MNPHHPIFNQRLRIKVIFKVTLSEVRSAKLLGNEQRNSIKMRMQSQFNFCWDCRRKFGNRWDRDAVYGCRKKVPIICAPSHSPRWLRTWSLREALLVDFAMSCLIALILEQTCMALTLFSPKALTVAFASGVLLMMTILTRHLRRSGLGTAMRTTQNLALSTRFVRSPLEVSISFNVYLDGVPDQKNQPKRLRWCT